MTLPLKLIVTCVICGKNLKSGRKHVDTCGERCFKKQLKQQREIFPEWLREQL